MLVLVQVQVLEQVLVPVLEQVLALVLVLVLVLVLALAHGPAYLLRQAEVRWLPPRARCRRSTRSCASATQTEHP